MCVSSELTSVAGCVRRLRTIRRKQIQITSGRSFCHRRTCLVSMVMGLLTGCCSVHVCVFDELRAHGWDHYLGVTASAFMFLIIKKHVLENTELGAHTHTRTYPHARTRTHVQQSARRQDTVCVKHSCFPEMLF